MSDCAQFWAGEFGDAYTRRNRVDWLARIPFWFYILNKTQARSVLRDRLVSPSILRMNAPFAWTIPVFSASALPPLGL